MPRLGLGLGLNLPKPVYSKNWISVPSGFVGQYLSYYFADFNLVTGDNVETWGDRSTNNNDLTQTTSANQPLLVETDVVKQSTLANMPTLVYDKEVTQDTGANQPTLVDTGGGVLAIETGVAKNLKGLVPVSGDKTYELVLQRNAGGNNRVLSSSSTTALMSWFNSAGIYIISDQGNTFPISPSTTTKSKLVLKFIGNSLEFWNDDVLRNTHDITGNTFTFDTIARNSDSFNGYYFSIRQWNSAVSDPTNIVETPDFELLPDPTTMRKTDGTQPSVGDSVQGWWATDAVLAMDYTSSDHLIGLDISGDFTVELDLKVNRTTTCRVLGSTLTSAEITISDNLSNTVVIYKPDDNTFQQAVGATHNQNRTTFTLHKLGNSLKIYVGSNLLTDADVTGQTFTLNALGSTLSNGTQNYLYGYRAWNTPVSDPTNIVETPDFELLPQTQYLRNSAGVEASAGDSISAWKATTHNQFDNVVRADATNDLMVGLPAHNALVFRKAVNTLGTQKVLFSSSTTSAQIRTNASNQIEVVSDAGTVFTYATSTVLTTQQTTILQVNGTNLELYESPTLLEAKDFTGETLTIDRVLGSASDTDWKEIWPYPNALDENSRNYFYYLRNDQNEILLPPLLPS